MDIWVSSMEVKKKILVSLECIQYSKTCYEPNTLINNLIGELNESYNGWHKIFTDGSKGDHGQGAGIYDQTFNCRDGFKITCEASIMSLELIAIHQALSYALNHNLNKFVILSDSKSALQHVLRCASGRRGASIAYDILKFISILNNGCKEFKLQWVPAHIGLKGNEEADRVAKLAAVDGRLINYLPDYWELVPKVKNMCFDDWIKNFEKTSKDKGIWYRTIQREPPRVPWFDDANLSRNYVKLALRIRSGHYPSAKFAFLMKKVDSPNCQTCNKLEDVQHLLMDCVRNKNERDSLLNELKLNILDVGIIQSILSSPKSNAAKKICNLITVGGSAVNS